MFKKESFNSSEILKAVDLPRNIESPYPYVVLGDLAEVTKRLNVPLTKEIVGSYQAKLFGILYDAAPEGVTYIPTETRNMIRKVEDQIVNEVIKNNGELGIIQLDRYIGSEINDERYFKLNLSRGIDGGLTSRPGTMETPDEQLARLNQWAVSGEYKKLLIVDDVLAFGDTLVPLIAGIREVLPDSQIDVLVGVASTGGIWGGLEKVKEATGIDVNALTTVKASDENEWTSGMALPTARDFTFLGGKILSSEESQFNFPYFLPFSVPVVSFMSVDARFEISRELMNLSIEMVKGLDKANNRYLTVGDLVKSGFGVPMSKLVCLADKLEVPGNDTRIIDYLEYFKELMNLRENEIKAEAGLKI